MPNFPAPFPTNNPYTNVAEGYASSATSLHNALISAANQQAQRNQQQKQYNAAQDHQALEDQLKAFNEGWVPAETQKQTYGSSGQKSFVLRTPVAGQDSARQMNIRGRLLYKPTDAEANAAKLDDTNSFQMTPKIREDAKRELGIDLPENMRVSHGLLQDLHDAYELHLKMNPQPKAETFIHDTSGHFFGPDGQPAAVLLGDRGTVMPMKYGDAPGGRFDATAQGAPATLGRSTSMVDQLMSWNARQATGDAPAHSESPSPGSGIRFKIPDKPDRPPKSLHFETHVNDAGDATTLGYDPETGELRSTQVQKGIGLKHRDPNAEGKRMKMTAANARIIVQNKTKALNDAQSAWLKQTSEALTDDDKRDASARFRQAQQQAQMNYEAEISAATGQEIPHNAWYDRSSQPTQAGGSGRAGGAKPATPKIATLQDIRDYARKHNVSDAQAIRAAQAAGYKVAGR